MGWGLGLGPGLGLGVGLGLVCGVSGSMGETSRPMYPDSLVFQDCSSPASSPSPGTEAGAQVFGVLVASKVFQAYLPKPEYLDNFVFQDC